MSRKSDVLQSSKLSICFRSHILAKGVNFLKGNQWVAQRLCGTASLVTGKLLMLDKTTGNSMRHGSEMDQQVELC